MKVNFKILFKIIAYICAIFILGVNTLFFIITCASYRASDIPGTRASLISSTQYRIELAVSTIVTVACLCFIIYGIKNYIKKENKGYINAIFFILLLLIIVIISLAIL